MNATLNCSAPSCERPAKSRGWCCTHYKRFRPMPDCTIDGCSGREAARGLCQAHYTRFRRHGDPNIRVRGPRKACSVDGCTAITKWRGLCGRHVARMEKHGSTDDPKPPTAEQRFWAKVNKTETCWLWTGGRNSAGYGQINIPGKRNCYAHRFSYELHKAPIPKGMMIDHLCHVPECVNPEHLRAVTPAQNAQNRVAAARNTTGVRGVHRNSDGALTAQVTIPRESKDAPRIRLTKVFHSIGPAEEWAIAMRNKVMTHNELDRRRKRE